MEVYNATNLVLDTTILDNQNKTEGGNERGMGWIRRGIVLDIGMKCPIVQIESKDCAQI